MVPLESAPQELPMNGLRGFNNIRYLGQFCVPPLVAEVTISPYEVNRCSPILRIIFINAA
jgi:hypothetical protein